MRNTCHCRIFMIGYSNINTTTQWCTNSEWQIIAQSYWFGSILIFSGFLSLFVRLNKQDFPILTKIEQDWARFSKIEQDWASLTKIDQDLPNWPRFSKIMVWIDKERVTKIDQNQSLDKKDHPQIKIRLINLIPLITVQTKNNNCGCEK